MSRSGDEASSAVGSVAHDGSCLKNPVKQMTKFEGSMYSHTAVEATLVLAISMHIWVLILKFSMIWLPCMHDLEH